MYLDVKDYSHDLANSQRVETDRQTDGRTADSNNCSWTADGLMARLIE